MRLGALRRQLTLLFVLLIAAQATVLTLLCVRIQHFIALRSELRESEQVRTELHALRAAAIDAETGQRGFVITGQEEFLQPYRASVLTIQPRLERLRALTAHSPELQRSVAAMSTLLKVVQADLARLVEVRRHDGFEAAQRILSSGAQRDGMDQLRQLTFELDEVAQRRGQEQEESHQHASSTLITLAFFGLVGGMLLTAGLGVFARLRLSALGAPLGKRLVELARELRTAGKNAQRSAATLSTLAQTNAKTKTEVQAALELITNTAKELSTMAMEITRLVQRLAQESVPDPLPTTGQFTGTPAQRAGSDSRSAGEQKEALAAEIDRVVTLAVRVAQSALSIELTTSEQRRLLESAGTFEAQLAQSIKGVELAAHRAKQHSKELVSLTQELTGVMSQVQATTFAANGTSSLEVFPIQT